MNRIEVSRPEAATKKIRTSEDFELCFLRHQYFRRVKYNPTEAEMQPYMYIVLNLTKNTFFTYVNLFKSVGLELDDVVNIGRVHLVSFLGLYSLENNEKKKKELTLKYLVDKEREPTEAELSQKDRANFTCFFKQRMEDVVRVCRQKSRNVSGKVVEEYQVFCSANKPPRYPQKLVREYQELGYKKIDFYVFKSVRKKADVEHDALMFEFGGLWYVAIAVEQHGLEIEDVVGSEANPYTNEHNGTPDELYAELPIKGIPWSAALNNGDEIFEMTKEEKENDHYKHLFEERSDNRKRAVLHKFIAKNKNLVQYREEVLTARSILRTLGG